MQYIWLKFEPGSLILLYAQITGTITRKGLKKRNFRLKAVMAKENLFLFVLDLFHYFTVLSEDKNKAFILLQSCNTLIECMQSVCKCGRTGLYFVRLLL